MYTRVAKKSRVLAFKRFVAVCVVLSTLGLYLTMAAVHFDGQMMRCNHSQQSQQEAEMHNSHLKLQSEKITKRPWLNFSKITIFLPKS
jgi:hypothetical protein